MAESGTRAELIQKLEEQVKKLRLELERASATLPPLSIRITKSQRRFERIENPHGQDTGIGEFFLALEVTPDRDVYIPLSIASGKKPTGFIYQIEGTARGSISKAEVSTEGRTMTQITLGTILYAKIPKGVTGTFRIVIEIRGIMHKDYWIRISEINYKEDPKAARYKKFAADITSDILSLGS